MYELLFWSFSGLLAFTFAGYPALMGALSGWARNGGNGGRKSAVTYKSEERLDDFLEVSVVLVIANEARRIVSRLDNLLASDWPKEQFEIVVVSDGSTDQTISLIKEIAAVHTSVRLIELPVRQGKANGLNQGVAAARGEVVVFADARQRFESDCISRLVRLLREPGVGAVSGRLVVQGGGSAVGQGVGSYWEMETRLRFAEAELDSCIGCTGAVYAIRRSLYRPVPADTLLDDVVIPMQIVINGYRVRYEPFALAHDPQDLDPVLERLRKKRTLAGNFQMLFRHPAWLLPGRNRVWLQLLFHKYFRLAGPVFLAGIMLATWMLKAEPFYLLCFWLQVLLYSFAVAGLLFPRLKAKVFTWPAGFLFLNWMVLVGFIHYLRTPRTGAWEMATPR